MCECMGNITFLITNRPRMSKICSNFSNKATVHPGKIGYAQQGVQYHVDRKEEGNLISPIRFTHTQTSSQ